MTKKTQPNRSAGFTNKPKVTKPYETIKLGIDWHAAHYRVVRIIDNAGPEPAQRFTPQGFLQWVQKQGQLAAKVYSCYEAGLGGFVLHRQLEHLGGINYVVVPHKLDPQRRGVQTDRTDAQHLALELDRYVRGNPKALRPVYVPTPEQEARRQSPRQRAQLLRHRLSLASQGRCLLMNRGYREGNGWWKPSRWSRLQETLPQELIEALSVYGRLIEALNQEIDTLTRTIATAASAARPLGMGALTLEEIEREVCDWQRFQNRKQPGSYAGLVGGVSGSGEALYDLSLTKAGHRRLRTLLVELAWRMVIYQSQCRLIRKWRRVLFNPKASKRARKKAIVAIARQLLVDLWRWRTGRVTPEQLEWKMVGAGAAA